MEMALVDILVLVAMIAGLPAVLIALTILFIFAVDAKEEGL